jgi:ketosteroid isomerase-like protein
MNGNARDVARRFFAAIESRDLAAVAEVYAPDAVIWHNIDDTEKTREDSVATIAWALENIENLRYEEIRFQPLEKGFLQQHVCRGIEKSTGRKIELPTAVVCEVRGDRIARLEEYFDSVGAAAGVPLTQG